MILPAASKPLLEVRDLYVDFPVLDGTVHALQGVSLAVEAGKTLAVVGESGCGKSVTAQSIAGLISVVGGVITKGSIFFDGESTSAAVSKNRRTKLAGDQISIIFQDPMNSLNPTLTIGEQIAEPLVVHKGLSKRNALNKAMELLERVEIPEARLRLKQYPFEFSGGMLQRAVIAMSLACEPKLLIADEPTTALDATVQAQILSLLSDIQDEKKMAMMIITHDLGVVARMADDVAVMYGGRVVECGPSELVLARPSHPYMQGLWDAIPHQDNRQSLKAIPGTPPDLSKMIEACAFEPRCSHRMRVCQQRQPMLIRITSNRQTACWLHHEDAPNNALRITIE